MLGFALNSHGNSFLRVSGLIVLLASGHLAWWLAKTRERRRYLREREQVRRDYWGWE
jgi:hypothetical protein